MSRSTPFPRTHKIKYEVVKVSRDTGNSPLGHRGTARQKSPSVACNVKVKVKQSNYRPEQALRVSGG